MRVVLHIGVHKTGTTAIQGFLARNAAVLAGHGIVYKVMNDQRNNHHPLVIKFRPGNKLAAGQAAAAGLLDYAAAQGAHTLLISSEALAQRQVDLKTFLHCFAGHDIQALAYIRRPDDIVASAYDEVVRDPRHRWTRGVTEPPLPYDPTYMKTLGRWMSEPLTLRLAPYDRQQWPGNNLFADFLSMLGIDTAEGFDLTAPASEANVRLAPQLTEVLRLANMHPAATERHMDLVAALYRLQRNFPGLLTPVPAMSQDDAAALFAELEPHLPQLRGYFRPGFDESFLHLNGHPDNGVRPTAS